MRYPHRRPLRPAGASGITLTHGEDVPADDTASGVQGHLPSWVSQPGTDHAPARRLTAVQDRALHHVLEQPQEASSGAVLCTLRCR
jgi:hypothetical protein